MVLVIIKLNMAHLSFDIIYSNLYNWWKPIETTMCETYEIPEKEVVPNKKLEKEKQSNQEEKPLTVTA